MSINSNLQQIVWSPGVSLDAIEQQVIVKAYHFFQKNKMQTASALGIAVRTLDAKLERYEKEEKDRAAFMEEEKRKAQAFVDRQRGFVSQVPEAPYGSHLLKEKDNVPIPPASPESQAVSEPMQVTTLSHPHSKKTSK